MPYTTRADGDVLTASSHNANCRDQVVSTVTSGTRPAGTEGQIIYETDTDLLYIYNGGWVQFGGAGAWTSYTPVLTQSGAVTKTVTYAKYSKIGRTVSVNVYLAATGAGTANNAVTVSLPFTSTQATLTCGSGFIQDASAALNYPGVTFLSSTTVMALIDATQATGAAVSSLGVTGSAFAAALASGDVIIMSATYESTT